MREMPPFNYVGRVNCVTGYGAAARHQVWVLRELGGQRLRILDAGSTGDPDRYKHSVLVQRSRVSSPGVQEADVRGTIVHLAPNCAEEWIARTPGPHALVSVWETDRLPAEWVTAANRFDQVWCPTNWQAGVYEESGVDPTRIWIVPFALDPALYPPEGQVLNELQTLRNAGYFIFGSMFQWTARKAPELMIRAFCQAFPKGEKVVLALKSYEGDSPHTPVAKKVDAVLKDIRWPMGTTPPMVRVISREMTADEAVSFYRGLDAYISTHRGEGWGLPIHEALLLEKTVVATNWSAPAEYAVGSYLPIPFVLEPPSGMDWQPFYFNDQLWAHPSSSSLVARMQDLFQAKPVTTMFNGREQLGRLVPRALVAAKAALDALPNGKSDVSWRNRA